MGGNTEIGRSAFNLLTDARGDSIAPKPDSPNPPMETAAAPSNDRKEDYPIAHFRRLEAQLQSIRNRAMKLASEKAAVDQPDGAYAVSLDHQNAALTELIADPHQLLRLVGLQTSSPK